MRYTLTRGDSTVETESAVERTRLLAQGYSLAQPAKNKSRSSDTAKTKAADSQ